MVFSMPKIFDILSEAKLNAPELIIIDALNKNV